jgi:hypothetical protein
MMRRVNLVISVLSTSMVFALIYLKWKYYASDIIIIDEYSIVTYFLLCLPLVCFLVSLKVNNMRWMASVVGVNIISFVVIMIMFLDAIKFAF